MPRSSPPSWTLKALTLALSLVLSLALAEAGLRGLEALRGEAEIPDYGDTWRDGGLGPGGFLRENFSGRVRDGYGGTVRWVNNAAGFRRDEETSRERRPGTLRILSLGDSFAAGYRVDQEETYSHLLEARLEATGRWRDVEVLIAVVEEPATGLAYLDDEGLRWQPDLVLLGITLGNDLAQTYVTLDPREDHDALVAELATWTLPPACFDPHQAHPPERAGPSPEPPGGLRLLGLLKHVQKDLKDRREPRAVASLWGEYTHPRLFDNHGLGMYLEPAPARIETAHERLFQVLTEMRELCAAHEIELLVTLFPQRFQVQPRDWQAAVHAYGLRPECFDLAAPNRRLMDFCRRAGLLCLDPTADLARRFGRTGDSLYLPRGDMHWNARGHRALADAIEDVVLGQAVDVGAPM